MKVLHFLLSSLLLLTSTACGYHLRGSQQVGKSLEVVADVHIRSSGAARLEKEVRLQFAYAGVTIVPSPREGAYVVELKQEKFDKSVLTVSPETGKVEEYLLSYEARMSITDPDGRIIVRDNVLSASTDLAFAVDDVDIDVLGKLSEENVIWEELLHNVARQVANRLQTLIGESHK